MRIINVVFLCVFALVSCGGESEEISAIENNLKNKYGIYIGVLDSDVQLPKSVLAKAERGETTVHLSSLDDAEYYEYLEVISSALSKYPEKVIFNNIDRIYVGGPYKEGGAVIAGMYEGKSLYLFYRQVDWENKDLFLEQTLHHELSSVLIREYGMDAFAWIGMNPDGFSYIINPREIDEYMSASGSYDADEGLLEQGLVSSYGKTNAENDINTYAELVFTEPQKMMLLVEKYPVVARKYRFLKRFYLSISPDFKSIFP